MEYWDALKMLDIYIHDYMIKNNMHDAADIFAKEANVCLQPVVINSTEGFLTEWWSLFWDVYSDRRSKHPEAMEGSSSKASQKRNWSQNILLEWMRPDMNCRSQNIWPTVKVPGCPSQPQSGHLTATPSPEMVNFHQSSRPVTMLRPDMAEWLRSACPTTQRPNLNPNFIGSPSFVDFNIWRGNLLTNSIAASIHEQGHLRFPERDVNYNSQLRSVDQIARMLPSSSKKSHPLEIVPQKPPYHVSGNGEFCTRFPGHVATQPIYHEESKFKQHKTQPPDSDVGGHCTLKGPCCCLERDSSTSSNSPSSEPSPESNNLF